MPPLIKSQYKNKTFELTNEFMQETFLTFRTVGTFGNAAAMDITVTVSPDR